MCLVHIKRLRFTGLCLLLGYTAFHGQKGDREETSSTCKSLADP